MEHTEYQGIYSAYEIELSDIIIILNRTKFYKQYHYGNIMWDTLHEYSNEVVINQ